MPTPTAVDIAEATEAALLDTLVGLPGTGERILSSHELLALTQLAPAALAEWAGISLHRATRLAAAFEIGRRAHTRESYRPPRIRSARDAVRLFRRRLAPLVHEELWIAALDGRGGLRGTRRIGSGAAPGTTIHAPDVLQAALSMGALQLVMAENRPGGDPTPSPRDIAWTTAIQRAADLIGLSLAHHVILTPGRRWAEVNARPAGG